MPRIPQYDSRETIQVRKLTTEAPAIRIQPDTSVAQAIGGMGKAMAEIGEKIYTLQAQNELSKANTSTYAGIKSIEETEDIEPEGWLDRRNKEIQTLREQTLKTMRNPLAKQQFQAEFDRDIIDTQYKLKKTYVGLTIGQTLKTFYEERDATAEKIYSAVNETEKQLEIDKIGKRYSELGRLGAMTPQAALREFREWRVGLNEGQVKWDIYNDTAIQEENSIVLNELKKSKDGIYPNLLQETRLKLIEESQKRIFQNNQTFRKNIAESQNIRHDTILDKISAGILTLKDIENEMAIPEEQGGMPKKILVSYQKALERGIENDLKKIISEKRPDKKPTERAINAKKYLDLIDNFIDDNVDLWRAREVLADSYADGIVNPQEAKFLNQLKQNLTGIEWNRQSGFIKGVIEGVKQKLKIQSNPSDEELALRIKQLLGGLATGKNPDEMANQVISNQLESDLNKIRIGKYQVGDKKVIDGRTYIRNEKGQWLSQ